MSKSMIALCCSVMGVVLAACRAEGATAASITPTGQTDVPSMSLTAAPVLVQPSATSTPAWAVFPSMPATSYTIDALYQPFEHGFMVWRGDENCVYALSPFGVGAFDAIVPAMLSNYSYCLAVDPLPDGSEGAAPPAGLLLPTGSLGKVWSFYPEVRAKLGYALQPESSYLSIIPAVDLPVQDGVWEIPQMSLPDGHILACGARGATAGTCRWFNTK